MSENYKFFQHKTCEYFPCHKTKDKDSFNCLFCYCPLYTLGSKCGGNFTYTESGIKNCTNCMIPHSKNGYEYIMSKWADISKLASQNK
ncbi:cysteine-rich small domain-containing protein [Hathewaya limosa]|uniref:Zn-finger protein n=1 Tax=Hathewaya limosa TaxID=1536 RepID=A0ABU0JVE3_HATLI|nr:cysteine-rich small domain-containing protein [Hathewaya limosa]AWZ47456.1 metal-binding protein [Clostridiaceae bacterium 14S0207]MDQ0480098.1 Zn-finger protein [Hathewaya limosa]